MATTPRGIYYPTVNSTLTPLANHFASLASSVDDAIGSGISEFSDSISEFTDDSGWINLSSSYFLPGFTTGGTPGTLQYRIRGGIIYWRGGMNGSFPTNTYVRTVEGFPSELRPSNSSGAAIRGGAAFSGAGGGLFEISPGEGSIVFGQSTGTTRNWGAFNISYPLG